MKLPHFFLLPFICPLFISSCGSNSSQKVSEIKSAGQSLYEMNCTACHGTDGKLNILGAKDLSVSVFTKEQAIEIITNGKNTMTPFANVMTKEEISAVADYIQTLK